MTMWSSIAARDFFCKLFSCILFQKIPYKKISTTIRDSNQPPSKMIHTPLPPAINLICMLSLQNFKFCTFMSSDEYYHYIPNTPSRIKIAILLLSAKGEYHINNPALLPHTQKRLLFAFRMTLWGAIQSFYSLRSNNIVLSTAASTIVNHIIIFFMLIISARECISRICRTSHAHEYISFDGNEKVEYMYAAYKFYHFRFFFIEPIPK